MRLRRRPVAGWRAFVTLGAVPRLRGIPAILLALSAACSPPGEGPAEVPSLEVSGREVLRSESGATQGVLARETLYLSGIVPPDTSATVAEQTRSAMELMGQTLGKTDMGYGHVVSCHVHLSDMDNYAEMNAVYGSFFEEGSYPARTTVEMPGIPDQAAVLLMCVAYADRAAISVVRPAKGETPPAMGPYSPAVRAGPTLYLSGQGGRDPQSGELADSTLGQTTRTMETVGAILGAGGLSRENAVWVGSYVPPPGSEADVTGVFEDLFGPGGAPSRTPVSLSRLPGDILVEITLVAVEDDYMTRLFMHDQVPTAGSSPASLSGGRLYTSSMTSEGETFRDQALGALRSQESLLELASMDWRHTVRLTAFLGDLAMREEFLAIVDEELPDPLPALSILQARHPKGTQIALDAIAVQ